MQILWYYVAWLKRIIDKSIILSTLYNGAKSWDNKNIRIVEYEGWLRFHQA